MATATSMDDGQSERRLHERRLDEQRVEEVRRLLRQREYRRAVELIDRRLLAVPEDSSLPVSIEDLRTYAYERLVRHGPEPSRRVPVNLRRGIPVSLRRPVPVDLRRLTRPRLERILRWLLAGELRAAEDAVRAGDYPTAVRAAGYAAQIDDRSTRVAFVHARALYELATAALDTTSPDFDEVMGQLQRAARLANRVLTDPAAGDSAKQLDHAIDEAVVAVQRRQDRTARVEAVNTVVRRFNQLVQHYDVRDQIVSQIQLGNARASLAQISAEVERLSRQHPADTTAGQVLADLREKCARYKLRLERLSRSVRAD